MSTSRQTFSQVKDILKRLDRSIDAARAKRLGDEPTSARTSEDPSSNGAPKAGPPLDRANGQSAFQRRVG